MKKQGIFYVLTAVLAGLLAFSTGAMAERPPGVGGGNGGGHDSGNEPPDYGDLFILYRDAYGVPILTTDGCIQPLAAETFDGCIQIPGTTDPADCRIIPVDPETCGVLPAYVTLTEEVEFGRMNEARSSDDVFVAQLEDATIKLATAGCISLDPAGRLMASSLVDPDPDVVGDEYTATSTIDSPLQNLAMYRKLVQDGLLGEDIGLRREWIAAAATSLGAAADKSGFVGVDLIVYLNEIMGLTDEGRATMLDPKICINIKEEVMGVIQPVRKCFLNYEMYNDGAGYHYSRGGTFGALPDPAYIGDPGVFEYLAIYDETADPITFYIAKAPIVDTVPELSADPTYEGWNIGAFAKAADDTRAVIDFMHNWPVPGDYGSTYWCDTAADTFFDVSISDVSGLQVPVRMVAGTEGREGTVTVSNAGPAEATGTVMVEGLMTDGSYVVMHPIDPATGLPIEAETIFDTPEEFTLPAGHSQSWTFFFSVAEPTTISWTAHADAGDNDVNPSNNTVYEETKVQRAVGGGKGAGGGEEH